MPENSWNKPQIPRQEQTLFKDLWHGNECRKKENMKIYEKNPRER